MKKLVILLFIYLSTGLYAQNTFKAVIKDGDSHKRLPGVTVKVKNTNIGVISDSIGTVILNGISDGKQTIILEHVAYEQEEKSFTFPLQNPEASVEIFLEEAFHETEEIVISTTRLRRNIEDIPTRVETITREEIEEKINMEPANVVVILNESTGIQTQQTSATSGNSTIRIQGLEGRYTQILKDGFPLFSGFAEGLSIMQLPPLDLKQVEVIKGPSSTLYGGGAIAGVINFISIEPEEKPQLSLLMNAESFGGFDAGFFYAGKKEKIGFTMLGTLNYKNAYDADNDDFTEIPKTRGFTISPKLFLYPDANTKINIGFAGTYENRLGGDVTYINNGRDTLHTYFEQNISNRYNFTFEANKTFGKNTLLFKSNAGIFNREIKLPAYGFKGAQYSTFSELSYLMSINNHNLIGGINFISDNFREKQLDAVILRDYNHYTAGMFIQDTWDITKKLGLEMGLRYDYQNEFGSFILPRITAFLKPSINFSFRLTGGLGYEIPTVFNEDSEREGFKNILPIDDDLKAETSRGVSADFNFKTVLFRKVSFSFNQLFYFTQIKDYLELGYDSTDNYFRYGNSEGNLNSKGFETNIRLVLEPFKLFAGYSFTDAKSEYNGESKNLTLIPKQSLGLVLMYEKHEDLRIGVEAYFTGEQYLYDYSKTPAHWIMCAMAQKNFGKFILFINFENFTDYRQSKHRPVVYSNHNNPLFEEIWTSTEGFYFNGGIKIKF
jgi:outer membrane receptor for ferrienterochelin and colicins